MMHLLFGGIKHSAETVPIAGEIFNDKDFVFICQLFNDIEVKNNDQTYFKVPGSYCACNIMVFVLSFFY